MKSRPISLATCSLAVSLSSWPLHAQQAADTGELQEIVVTAERRSQQVLSVPTSIQAETGVFQYPAVAAAARQRRLVRRTQQTAVQADRHIHPDTVR
jgi:outer membrane cobalamin receptor